MLSTIIKSALLGLTLGVAFAYAAEPGPALRGCQYGPKGPAQCKFALMPRAEIANQAK